MQSKGDGVDPYLISRSERSERKAIVLVALMRFNSAVHANEGTEEEKVKASKQLLPRTTDGQLKGYELLHKVNEGGGVQGVLGTILTYL